jgi:peptide/histidine transporter 3/4
VAPFFFVTDLFDRFSYYAATGSMTVYFQRLGLSSVLATQMQSTFQSIVYVAPLIGAYCADSFFGRYRVRVRVSSTQFHS